MNNVCLIGRLTRDPQIRVTKTGTKTASFTVAVNRFGKDKEADFINCITFKGSAEFMENYTGKGDLVSVEGSIQTRNYQDKTGKTVYVTEIVCRSVQKLEKKENKTENQKFIDNEFNNFDFGSDEIDSDKFPF